jgi:hypothetical protein
MAGAGCTSASCRGTESGAGASESDKLAATLAVSGGEAVAEAWRAEACRNRCSSASKLDPQRPHRTHPEDTLSWSLTTRKAVPQAGQRVASVIRA